MRLLKVTEDLKIEILPETLLIPEFKNIVKRTKKCKEDHDGRQKLMAKKELAYVFHMASTEGPYASYTLFDRHIQLANDLFEDHTWQPDEEVKVGIERFKELNQTPSSQALNTIINALHKSNKIVDALINQIEQDLTEEKHKSGINNKKGQIVSGVELMLNDLQALLKVANEIPKSIDQYEKLDEKILKEKQAKASKYRGSAEINDFERS
jgi:hypothetical protein